MVLAAVGGRLAAALAVADAIRPEAAGVVAALGQMGIEVSKICFGFCFVF